MEFKELKKSSCHFFLPLFTIFWDIFPYKSLIYKVYRTMHWNIANHIIFLNGLFPMLAIIFLFEQLEKCVSIYTNRDWYRKRPKMAQNMVNGGIKKMPNAFSSALNPIPSIFTKKLLYRQDDRADYNCSHTNLVMWITYPG